MKDSFKDLLTSDKEGPEIFISKPEVKRFTEEELVKIIEDWKFFWMDQKFSEEDRKNYFNRSAGIDANMIYSLARRIMEAQ